MGDVTIALCMIVRDEAPIIARALRSCREIISSWLVVEPGSTDATPAIVERELAGIPGRLERRTWRNFGANRTEALGLAAELGSRYLLLLDADDELERHFEPCDPFGHAAYWLEIRTAGCASYHQPRVLAAALPWRYVGDTHEYLDGPGLTPRTTLPALAVRHHCDGSRWPRKLADDRMILEQAFERDPHDARTVFYLANTYRDLGEHDRALGLYLQRATMGGCLAEAQAAAVQAARLAAGDATPVNVPTPE